MCLIDGSNARVCIIVGIHAKAKRLIIPERCGFPVIVVMAEAVHSLRDTFLFHARFFVLLPFLFAQTFLFEFATRFALVVFFIVGAARRKQICLNEFE